MKKYKLITMSLLLLSVFLIAACSPTNIEPGSISGESDLSGFEITVYKSQSCGCCSGYISELERRDFNVETIEKQDTTYIKDEYNIPQNMRSCHTAVIEGYFIEGHVPVEAVNKLLEERPDVDGIALAGMPSGSPGMPGSKREDWKIYSIKDGVPTLFMTI